MPRARGASALASCSCLLARSAVPAPALPCPAPPPALWAAPAALSAPALHKHTTTRAPAQLPGAGSPPVATSTTPVIVYIGATNTQGNMGGRHGADNRCASPTLATRPANYGNYKCAHSLTPSLDCYAPRAVCAERVEGRRPARTAHATAVRAPTPRAHACAHSLQGANRDVQRQRRLSACSVRLRRRAPHHLCDGHRHQAGRQLGGLHRRKVRRLCWPRRGSLRAFARLGGRHGAARPRPPARQRLKPTPTPVPRPRRSLDNAPGPGFGEWWSGASSQQGGVSTTASTGTCSDWTSSTAGGATGNAGTGNFFYQQTNFGCGNGRNLLCIAF